MPVKTTNEIEALYDACIFGETENIDRILGEDDLKEYGAKNLQKAVMFAANQKDKKIAVQLLSNKIIVDEINTLKNSMTPLMIAIDYGLGSNVIDELILSSNLDAVDDYGLSALMYAIMKGDLNLVKKLDMTDKSISDNDSNSLLLTAVKSGNIDIVDYLLDTRSIPELTLTNYEGKTALHVAAEENHIDVLKLLIKDPIFKSQLNTKDIYGRTPLDIALEQKSDDCIQLLERQTNKNETFAKNSTYGKPLTQLGQSVLNNKVAQYLTLHGQDSRQILQYGGNCSGWAFLFHIYIAAGREDDFYEMLGCIESWDGSMESLNNTQLPLSLKGKYKDLEDFFLHITNDLVIFQFTTDITKELQLGWTQESRVEQYALVRDFSVGHELKAVFNHTFDSMSQEQLTEMLAFYSRWPGAHFDIGGGKHATSLYIMPDGKFKYYDPNLKNKMKIIDSAEELSDYIVKTKYKHIDMINDGKFSISFDAYKFYKSLDKIPELEKPLTTEQHKKYSPNGLTPLHYAVMENDLEKAHKLMQDHPNLINELDAFGNSAFEYIGLMSNINFNMLDLFAQSGKVDLNSILCKLIKAKKNLPFIKAIANQPALDINQPHEQSKSILLFALNEYDLDVFSRTEIIQILLQHPNIDINKKNNRGKSPLMLALKYKVNPDVIKLFLSRPELQTNIADDKNKTALYYAIKSGYDIDIIQSILQLSLKEKSYKELYDSTTLKEAIKNRNLELYSMLLEAGATLDGQILFDALESFSYTPEVIEMLSKYNIDINAKNEDGETPLMVALEDEVSPETIKLLLSNPTLRADVTDDNDETALQHAIDNGYSLEIIQTILQLSLQEKPYAELYSPSLLGNAIDNNNIELINLFLEYGAILNEEAIYNTEDEKTRDHIQGWRLYHAIIKNDLQEVHKILRACPQALNIPTYQGFTPCEIAIEKENIDPLILSTLLSSPHLDLQRKNKKGKTLLHYAIQNEVSIDVFSLLLKNPNIDLNIIDNFERPPVDSP
ncbi:MAG: hypothetical protein BGO43_07645 [Gammaproteobacteria bacterium 39-13]|nr:ankyrin repeat domain-containing protein [Gammaproteobacteria bacterium]OJV93041.1 MAG: hypothetical protein BGO43_07645 [Gammaproteobacteria bacterium 39-13]